MEDTVHQDDWIELVLSFPNLCQTYSYVKMAKKSMLNNFDSSECTVVFRGFLKLPISRVAGNCVRD
jgi:hypothetical protein